ncbi:hypothetical protein [Deinococcus alpinitundrae]|uniref:hypothetical protein n=1 Tax=Deinococcus alpinitundrae TaxID=468913 RepID=UPI001379D876|nr:hypothetical protein [Deinococcus alpinitundrae]
MNLLRHDISLTGLLLLLVGRNSNPGNPVGATLTKAKTAESALRRIIEGQWHRFLDQIIKFAEKTGLDERIIDQIKATQTETQFSKAVKVMGEAISPILKINGHNPISLMYAALSEGVHDKSDQECLELAVDVRTVIYKLAERLNLALQEHDELDAAVKRLAARNSKN